MRQKLLIIGTGRFAKVLFRLLSDTFDIYFLTRKNSHSITDDFWQNKQLLVKPKSLIGSFDIIIPAVPISKIAIFLKKYAQYFKPNQLIIDIASVKVYPQSLKKNITLINQCY